MPPNLVRVHASDFIPNFRDLAKEAAAGSATKRKENLQQSNNRNVKSLLTGRIRVDQATRLLQDAVDHSRATAGLSLRDAGVQGAAAPCHDLTKLPAHMRPMVIWRELIRAERRVLQALASTSGGSVNTIRPTEAQLEVMQAYNCAIAPVIFKEHLLTWKDVLAHRYNIRSYQRRVAIQCPRRFGKSLWTCIFLICLAVAYLKCGMGAQAIMVCASKDQAAENYKYDCMALEALRGHWCGEYSTLDWRKPTSSHRLFIRLDTAKDAVESEVFMTPNINLSQGKVRNRDSRGGDAHAVSRSNAGGRLDHAIFT